MLIAYAVLIIASTAAGSVDTKSLPKEPGVTIEGQNVPLGPDDEWMLVRMYIDKHGSPDKCRTIETNITSKDKRFWVCQTMMHQWHTDPIIENGVTVPGVVLRRFVISK